MKMKWAFYAILTLSLSNCAHTSSTATSTGREWCATIDLLDTVEEEDLSDVHVINVASERAATAKSLLENVTLIELSLTQVRNISVEEDPRLGYRYYLIRSGVFAPPGSSPRDIAYLSRNVARRLFFWVERSDQIIVASFQLLGGERDLFNYPLIVGTRTRPLRSAAAVCSTLH